MYGFSRPLKEAPVVPAPCPRACPWAGSPPPSPRLAAWPALVRLALGLILLPLARPFPTQAADPEPPTILSQPINHVAVEGDTHTFTVTAAGASPLAYQWRFNNNPISNQTNATLTLNGIAPGNAGNYRVVITNTVGSVTSSVATLTVRSPSDPKFATPQGGWSYSYLGIGTADTGDAALDGTWNHDNGSDSWAGDGRGPGVNLPGGIGSVGGIATFEDALVSGSSSVDNRRLYLTHDLAQESSVTNASTLLDDGVTLSFRARLTPPPPADPLTELASAPNGYINVTDGKGMFGIRQSGGGGLILSFSLHQQIEDRTTTTTFDFGQAGLHMNNLNGNVRSPNVDPGEGGTLNVLPLNPAVFQEFWITIQDNSTDPGTHRVSIYTNGNTAPLVFQVTAGTGNDLPADNYLALGLGSTFQVGAFDLDYFAFKPGVITPFGFNVPVAIATPPATRYVAAGQTATFGVEATGTPPYQFQWRLNGAPIPNATNQFHTTPAAVPADDGGQYTVIVQNNSGSVTSSPPALLEVVAPPVITSHPQNLTVTNGSPATFTVAASGEFIQSYQWRRNGANLTGETNATLLLPAASPALAGTYDVAVINPGGAPLSNPATLTVLVQDFGDAPDPSYPTLAANNGARHLLAPGVFLGVSVDFEVDALPDASAAGDDLNGSDDEDGVVFASPLRVGQSGTLDVAASTNGVVNAWIDFNQDGSWSQPGDQILTNRALAAGLNSLAVTIPSTATPGPTFARFRFNTAGNLGPAGPAANGEVEDYSVTLVPVADLEILQTASPDPVATGGTLVLQVTVTNRGPSLATGILLTNHLPAMLSMLNAVPSQGSCQESGGILTCTLGDLPAGQSAFVTLTATPAQSGSLTNRASVAGAELDLQPGNNTSTRTVLVLDPPIITTQPQSLTVTNGHAAAFSVAATGASPLHYQWRFNGSDLLNATNTSLNIASAQPANQGAYTVRVTNRVASILSAPATLTVLVPPAVTVPPQNTTAYAGSTVTFTVVASGTEPLGYQWHFNAGNPIPGATGATLTLSNVLVASAGNYTATISNAAGIVTSPAATLTVIEADFGDAPAAGYPTTLAQNGARHRIVPHIRLGAGVDFEPDGLASSNADGDDTTGGDDEDGVSVASPILVGQTLNLNVTASTNGIVNAWIDWNLDGDWADAGEHVLNGVALSPGVNALNRPVPANATPGSVPSRFRFSTANMATFDGEAANGEIEDHLLLVQPAVDLRVAQSAQPAPVTVGSNLVYSILVSNQGPSAASAILLTNVLPANATFVGANPSQGSCSMDAGRILCNLGGLAPGAGATLTLTLTPFSSGSMTNQAVAIAAESELTPANNSAVQVVDAFVYPAITAQPQPVTVTNGHTATFQVTATGTALTYQWRFHGTNLVGRTNASLVLANAQPANAGPYSVVVQNPVGAVTSTDAALTVLVPPAIVTPPQNRTVIQGQPATFMVAASGTAPLAYQWRFEGAALPGQTNATLSLANVQPSQQGAYTVTVTNVAGSVLSAPATLTVLIPPAITQQPQSRTNLAGSTAAFSVEAAGTAPIQYQWLFNGSTPLPNANQPTLTLPNVTTSLMGAYSVRVSNAAGTNTSAPATLSVLEVDFGDAPDPYYPTLLVFNGARHTIVPGIHLGATVDFEPDAWMSPDATGDDANGTDDEDGVVFDTPLRVGQISTLTLTASTSGFVDAWIDLNGNGQWIDAGEQLYSSQPVVAGPNILPVEIPASAPLGATVARFRFSTGGGLAFDGLAADGEVEDHATTIQPAIDLAVSQSIAPGQVLVGGGATFSIQITNRGPSLANGIRLTNSIAANLGLLAITPSQGSCSNMSGTVVCDLGSLAATAAASVSISVTALKLGLATNIVQIHAAEHDVDGSNNTSTRILPVVLPTVAFQNNTPLNLADNGPASLYPSTITVSGLTATVHKVTVTLSNLAHTFPDDFDILLVGPSGQNVLLMSDAVGNFFLNNISITLDDDAALDLPNAGEIFNGQRYRPTNHGVSPDEFPAPAPAGPYGAALSVLRDTNPNGVWSLYAIDDFPEDFGLIGGGWSLGIQTIDPFADLAVAKIDSPNPVAVGSNILYSITLTNLGPNTATAVTATDLLPPGLVPVSATPSQGTCTINGATVQCALGTLNPGANALITLAATATTPGFVTNSVAVASALRDILPLNNSASTVTLVTPVVDLAVLQSAAPQPALVESELVCTLTVTNQGSNPASNVQLTDVLPANTTLLNTSVSQGACTQLNNTVSCNLGDLDTAAAATLVLTLRPHATGLVTNRATITATQVDRDAANNISTRTITVVPSANLALAGAASPNPVVVTRDLTYSLVLTNLGPSPAGNVLLSNTLPANTEFVSANASQGDCSHTAGVVSCTLGSLSPGATATLTLAIRPLASGSFANAFSVGATEADPDPANNSVALVTTVAPAADLRVTLNDSPDPVLIQQPFSYLIQVNNLGPDAVGGVVLSNPLPAGLTFLGAAPSQGACTNNAGTLLCALGSLANGAQATVTLNVASTLSGRVTNTVNVRAVETDLDPLNNTATQSTTVAVFHSPAFNTTALALTNAGPATLYPSTILLSGHTASVHKVTVTLSNLHHTFPDDLDILLVGPGGHKTLLLSDAGGANAVTNITLTFDDDAPGPPGNSAPLTSGTFQPSNYASLTDVFPPPAPAGPHGTSLAVFAGTDPNGVWSLFVFDDLSPASGGLLNGWSLRLETLDPIANLALSQFAAPNPVAVGSNLTVSVTVTNLGPARAHDVLLTGVLPPQLSQPQAAASQGSCTISNGLLNCSLGLMNPQTTAQVTLTARPYIAGLVTNALAVRANELDLVPLNNSNAVQILVEDPPEFVLQPASLSVTNLSDVTFMSLASGTGPIAYQWQFNGANLPGATNANLPLGPVTLDDVGLYRVRASNRVGAVFSATAQLTVRVPPTINPPADAQTDEDTRSAPLAFTVNDMETPAGDLLVFGSSSNPALVPAGGFLFGGSGANRTVAILPATNAFGSATVTITVRDSDGMEASTAFVLTVLPVNDPPSIGNLPNQVTMEDTPTGLIAFTVDDPESGPDTVTLAVASSNPTLLPAANIVLGGSAANRTLMATPATNLFGTTTITLTATDPLGASRPQAFVLTVLAVNDPPTLDAIPNVELDEDAPVQNITLTGISSGAPNESQFLNLSATSDNPGLVPNPVVIYTSPNPTATLFFLPTANSNGTATVTVSVNDGSLENNPFTRRFTITVHPVNDPPTITAVPDQSVNEDTTLSIPVTVNDLESHLDSLVITGSASNTNLLPVLNIQSSGSGSNRTVHLLPATNLFGAVTVTLRVTDNQSGFAETSFLLTVNPVNDPPALAPIPDLALVENSGEHLVNLTGIGSGATNETETVALSATSSNPNLIPNPVITYTPPNTTASLRLSLNSDTVGTTFIRVTADDGQAANALTIRSFIVTVKPPDTPPAVSPVSDLTLLEDAAPVFLPFTVFDLESPASTLAVSVDSSNPALVPIQNIAFFGSGPNRALSLSPVPNASGAAIITLTATATNDASSSSAFTVTVLPVNDPPTLDPVAGITIDEDASPRVVALTGITSGAANESQPLVVTARSDQPRLIPHPTVTYASPESAGSLTVVPAPNASGTATVTVTVNDGANSNNLLTRSFQVTVNAVNDPPAIAPVPNQSASVNQTVGPIALLVSDADQDPGALALSAVSDNAVLLPQANIALGGSGAHRTLTLTPATNQTGTARITLTLNDGAGGVTNTAFTLAVSPANRPPSISNAPSLILAEDSPATNILVTIGDLETPANSLVLAAASSNPLLLPPANIILSGDQSNRTVTITPAPNRSGTATLTLTVTDGAGGKNLGTLLVTVNAVNDPPALSPVPGQTMPANTTLHLALTATDIDSDPAALVLIASASNASLVPNANLVLSGSGSARKLSVSPLANQSGAAQISLVLSDPQGASVTNTFSLTVTPPALAAPLFITQPESLSVTNGQPANFTSAAAGSTPITFQWQFNNANLAGQTNNNLTLPAAQPSNAGNYRVIAANAAGSATSQVATLTILPTPPANPPPISPIANQSTPEDTPLTVPFIVGTSDADAFNVALSAASSNTGLLATNDIRFDGFGTNRTVTLLPSPNQSGSAQVTLSARNAFGTSTSVFTLTVTAVNDPPTLDPLPNIARDEGPTAFGVPLAGITSGAANESQTLSVSAVSSNPSIVSIQTISYSSPNATGTLTLKPSNNQTGPVTITVTINDNQGANNTFSRSFLIHSKNAGNAAPTISAIPNQSINENAATAALPFTVNDAETAATSLSVLTQSSNPSLVPIANIVLAGAGANRTVTVTPLSAQTGASVITILVVDAGSGAAETQFTVTVNPVNDPPSISILANQTLDEDARSSFISFTVGDQETPAGSLAVTAASSNPTLLPNTGILLGGTGASRALQLVPEPNQSGAATVTLTVNDGSGGSTNRAFNVTVNPVNDLPTITAIPNQSANVNQPIASIPFTIGDQETPAANLALGATSSNPALLPNGNIAFGGAGASRNVTLSPLPNQTGVAIVTLTVNDTNGGATNRMFSLTVTGVSAPPNTPPTLNTITNVSVLEDASPVNIPLAGITAGSGGESQLLSITAVSDNPAVFPNPGILYTNPQPTGVLILQPLPNANGAATITVTVDDGQPASNIVSRTFIATVNAVNDPPVLSPLPDMIVPRNTSVGPLLFSVFDAETPAGSLALTAGSSNTNLVANAALTLGGSGTNRTLSFAPQPGATGVTVITLAADDGTNNVSQTFTLSLVHSNTPPSLSVLPNQSLNEDAVAGPIAFTVNDAETGAGALTLSVASSNPALLPVAGIALSGADASRSLTLTPAPDQNGAATVTVVATDGDGASATRTFQVTVNPLNDRPTLSPLSNRTVDEDTLLGSIPFDVGDAETPPGLLILTARSSNTNLVAATGLTIEGTNSARALRIALVRDASGTATLEIAAADTDGASVTNAFLLTVNAVNDPPIITDLPTQSTMTGVPTAPIPFVVLDAETPAASLTVTARSSNQAIVSDANIRLEGAGTNRTVTLTPDADRGGTAVITLTVIDGDGAESSDAFLLVADGLNTAPIISAIADQVTTRNVPAGPVAFTVSDVESPADQILITPDSSNPNLLPPANILLGGSGSNRTVTLTPAANQLGSATITLMATDPNGEFSTIQFLLTVNESLAPTAITQITVNAAAAQLTFDTVAGLNYTVEFNNSPGSTNWTALPSIPGTGSPAIVTDSDATAPVRIYRVRTN